MSRYRALPHQRNRLAFVTRQHVSKSESRRITGKKGKGFCVSCSTWSAFTTTNQALSKTTMKISEEQTNWRKKLNRRVAKRNLQCRIDCRVPTIDNFHSIASQRNYPPRHNLRYLTQSTLSILTKIIDESKPDTQVNNRTMEKIPQKWRRQARAACI